MLFIFILGLFHNVYVYQIIMLDTLNILQFCLL